LGDDADGEAARCRVDEWVEVGELAVLGVDDRDLNGEAVAEGHRRGESGRLGDDQLTRETEAVSDADGALSWGRR
jgi:hypothetical protein